MVAKPYCTVFIVLCFVCHCTTDVAFEGFCSSPPHFGNGELKGDLCTVTYDFKSSAASEAMQLCGGAAPYVIKKATYGKTTVCIYENSNITCRTRETAIGNRCFIIGGYGDYSNFTMQCGWAFVQPHVIENDFEREWITASKGMAKSEVTDEKTLTIRVKAARDNLEGTLSYRDPHEEHPFLCSRIPKSHDEAIEPEHHKMYGEFVEVVVPPTTTEEPHGITTTSSLSETGDSNELGNEEAITSANEGSGNVDHEKSTGVAASSSLTGPTTTTSNKGPRGESHVPTTQGWLDVTTTFPRGGAEGKPGSGETRPQPSATGSAMTTSKKGPGDVSHAPTTQGWRKVIYTFPRGGGEGEPGKGKTGPQPSATRSTMTTSKKGPGDVSHAPTTQGWREIIYTFPGGGAQGKPGSGETRPQPSATGPTMITSKKGPRGESHAPTPQRWREIIYTFPGGGAEGKPGSGETRPQPSATGPTMITSKKGPRGESHAPTPQRWREIIYTFPGGGAEGKPGSGETRPQPSATGPTMITSKKGPRGESHAPTPQRWREIIYTFPGGGAEGKPGSGETRPQPSATGPTMITSKKGPRGESHAPTPQRWREIIYTFPGGGAEGKPGSGETRPQPSATGPTMITSKKGPRGESHAPTPQRWREIIYTFPGGGAEGKPGSGETRPQPSATGPTMITSKKGPRGESHAPTPQRWREIIYTFPGGGAEGKPGSGETRPQPSATGPTMITSKKGPRGESHAPTPQRWREIIYTFPGGGAEGKPGSGETRPQPSATGPTMITSKKGPRGESHAPTPQRWREIIYTFPGGGAEGKPGSGETRPQPSATGPTMITSKKGPRGESHAPTPQRWREIIYTFPGGGAEGKPGSGETRPQPSATGPTMITSKKGPRGESHAPTTQRWREIIYTFPGGGAEGEPGSGGTGRWDVSPGGRRTHESGDQTTEGRNTSKSGKVTTTTKAPHVEVLKMPSTDGPVGAHKGTRSTVIILDGTPSTFRDGWNSQVRFVTNIRKLSKLEAVAVVVIDCPSNIVVIMGSHTEEEISKKLMDYKFHGHRSATYQAYGLARAFVEKNPSSETTLIVVSDGKSSNCMRPETWENEFTLSLYWRGYGVRIIYVAVRGTKDFNMENIKKIIGQNGTIIEVDNISQLDKTAVQRVVPLIPPPP